MRTAAIAPVISIWIMTLCSSAGAGEKKADWVPLPQIAPLAPPAPVLVMPLPPRPGSMEMWQYYGVDRFGRFRPRVVLAPGGAYELWSGEPYPWINNRTSTLIPSVLGAPGAFIEPARGTFVMPTPLVLPAPVQMPAPSPFMPYAPD